MDDDGYAGYAGYAPAEHSPNNLADEMKKHKSVTDKWVKLVRLTNMSPEEIRSTFKENSAIFKACQFAGLV